MSKQRIHFDIVDPISKEDVGAFVDLEKRSDEIIITDWGVLYDRVVASTGGHQHLVRGRCCQPHWAMEVMEQKRRTAKPEDFPTFEGRFSVNDYKNNEVDSQAIT